MWKLGSNILVSAHVRINTKKDSIVWPTQPAYRKNREKANERDRQKDRKKETSNVYEIPGHFFRIYCIVTE